MAKIFYFCGHEQWQPEVLVGQARLAEEVGFDGVMVSEHFSPWVADVGAAGFAFSTLGAMAVQTSRLELMTGVVTPLWRFHPAVVAQAAATVDRLSNGRFSLGVGTGEPINEVPLGFEYPNYVERAARLREAVAIIRPMLRGEEVTMDGEFYRADRVKLYSPPVHDVPVLVAAGGPKTARLAAEVADGVIVSVKQPDEAMESVIEPARAKQSELRRSNFLAVATRWSVVAKNDDEAWEALKAWRGLRAPHRDTVADPRQLQREADELPREEVLSRYSRIRNADDFIKIYRPLIEQLRADIVVIQTTSIDQEATIRLLGKEVLPALKKL